MALQELLDFLAANKGILSWVGTGLAVVSGGAWAMVKFFWTRPGSDGHQAPSAPQQRIGPITLIGSPGARITNTQILGQKVSRVAVIFFWIGVLMLIVIAAVQVLQRYSSAIPSLPRVEVWLDCGEDFSSYHHENGVLYTHADAAELEGLNDLLNVAMAYSDQVILLSLEVWNTTRGECFRLGDPTNMESFVGDEPEDVGSGTMAMRLLTQASDLGAAEGYLRVDAIHPEEWAASYGFFFPPNDAIPNSTLYERRVSAGGTRLLDYEGPFVVRFDYDTGWGYVLLVPIAAPSDFIESRIKCTTSQQTFLDRLLKNCIAPTPSETFEDQG